MSGFLIILFNPSDPSTQARWRDRPKASGYSIMGAAASNPILEQFLTDFNEFLIHFRIIVGWIFDAASQHRRKMLENVNMLKHYTCAVVIRESLPLCGNDLKGIHNSNASKNKTLYQCFHQIWVALGFISWLHLGRCLEISV